MPTVYTVEFENQLLSANADIFQISPSLNRPCELIGLMVYGISELKEAEEEWVGLQIRTGTTPGGGTSITPRPVCPPDSAAQFTAAFSMASSLVSGSLQNYETFAFDVRSGFKDFFPESMGLFTTTARIMAVHVIASPADQIQLTATAWVREYP